MLTNNKKCTNNYIKTSRRQQKFKKKRTTFLQKLITLILILIIMPWKPFLWNIDPDTTTLSNKTRIVKYKKYYLSHVLFYFVYLFFWVLIFSTCFVAKCDISKKKRFFVFHAKTFFLSINASYAHEHMSIIDVLRCCNVGKIKSCKMD